MPTQTCKELASTSPRSLGATSHPSADRVPGEKVSAAAFSVLQLTASGETGSSALQLTETKKHGKERTHHLAHVEEVGNLSCHIPWQWPQSTSGRGLSVFAVVWHTVQRSVLFLAQLVALVDGPAVTFASTTRASLDSAASGLVPCI